MRKHDGKHKQNEYIQGLSEPTDALYQRHAHFFRRGKVAMQQVLEVGIEGVRHRRAKQDKAAKGNRNHFQVAHGIHLIHTHCHHQEEIEANVAVESDGMEAVKGFEIILNVAIRIHHRRHDQHKEKQRRTARERKRIHRLLVLSFIKRVQGIDIQKQATIMERKRI